jgi:hypothetical protein
VEDGLDVVAVGVADERAVVAGVILRPELWRVQRLRANLEGGVVERLHGVGIVGEEREMRFAVRTGRLVGAHVADPEGGLAVPAISDGDSEVLQPRVAKAGEDFVVERFRLLPVRAVDPEMVNHRLILA